jgi:hypothetical protein
VLRDAGQVAEGHIRCAWRRGGRAGGAPGTARGAALAENRRGAFARPARPSSRNPVRCGTGRPARPARAHGQRRFSTQTLIAYFLHARALPGRWAECGVFSGASSLALCAAARSVDSAFDGAGLHLVDSFEGLGPAHERDHESVRGENGAEVLVPPVFREGHFRTDFAKVQAAFADFPNVEFHKGWIPDVLATLPEARWSFVHVDVDLYAPTRACLEFFLPRLVPGGVIVCDDYGAPTFPGAARAWDEVCEIGGIPFVELPTGQAVILKEG